MHLPQKWWKNISNSFFHDAYFTKGHMFYKTSHLRYNLSMVDDTSQINLEVEYIETRFFKQKKFTN